MSPRYWILCYLIIVKKVFLVALIITINQLLSPIKINCWNSFTFCKYKKSNALSVGALAGAATDVTHFVAKAVLESRALVPVNAARGNTRKLRVVHMVPGMDRDRGLVELRVDRDLHCVIEIGRLRPHGCHAGQAHTISGVDHHFAGVKQLARSPRGALQ